MCPLVSNKSKYQKLVVMDITGKKGEKAAQQVSSLGQELRKLQDNVKSFEQNLNQYDDNLSQIYNKIEQLENAQNQSQEAHQRIVGLEEASTKISKLNRKNSERIRDLEKNKAEFRDRIGKRFDGLEDEVGGLRKRISNLEQKVQGLRSKLNELKEDTEIEFDTQENHLQRKVEKQSFENRNKKIDKELSKLRTSVNVLADELDRTDDITID